MKRSFDLSVTKNGPTFEGLTINVGSSPDDEEGWSKSLADPSPAAINEMAVQSLTIKVQGYIRRKNPKTKAEAQALADQYVYGGVRSNGRKPTVSKDLDWTPEQLAAMKAAGVQIK